jgi:hypothetical protein
MGEIGPWGELYPLGTMLTPSFNPRGEHSLLFRRIEGRTENFTPPQGITSPLGDKVLSWGTFRPWESKFASRGGVNNGPQVPTVH